MITHSKWLEKIIAKYSGNITPADCVALNEHVLSCDECAQAMKEYEELAICLRPLKDDTFITQLPPRMLALKKKIAQTAQKQERINDTNLRSERQFSNEIRRETTHVGLVPVNAGWYEVEKVLCNRSDKSWLDTKKNVIGKVGLVLSGLGLTSLVLVNLVLLPLDIILVFIFLPLLTIFLPVFFVLLFVTHLKSLDAEQMSRYSNTGRAYANLGRKYLKQPASVLGHKYSFPNERSEEIDRMERKPITKH